MCALLARACASVIACACGPVCVNSTEVLWSVQGEREARAEGGGHGIRETKGISEGS